MSPLCRRGNEIRQLFLDIVKLYLDEGRGIELFDFENEIIRQTLHTEEFFEELFFLEQQGYILSTDFGMNAHTIKIIPLGLILQENSSYRFCLNDHHKIKV